MDELNNGEQGQYVEPGKNEKKNNTRKIVKRTLLTAGLALAVYMVYSIVYLFISPDRNIQQIYLVPEDAAFIIQSSAPIEDWEKFSGSETWQCLRKAKSFEEVFEEALNKKIAEIFNPAVPFTQAGTEHSCKFCQFKSICLREED